ncbi:NAD-dependent epimerase/dehydratase family protein [Pseudonocardia alaniniphila]|uniref:NAD-dependent epimerase/dehydratase family protein n=1 Tax=Pseudonocardia alaniniphila TaxID=75291 RepID=A0ABS9TFS7_9PSEU|nr:NAD-dependent epimerase/dehydratase family protein [Pseudonocardia alaniniphila]MCH6167151.1 NAD-dependent epimerase/dehydratase family protein [Pseudonocardia alaniniphila]
MAERVLITGGAGFVGRHLARRLLREGAEVVVVDDFSRGRAAAEPDDGQRRPHVVEHDLTRPIPHGLLPGNFDTVYHLAAVVGVRRANENPSHVLRTNVLATLNLLDWCRLTSPATLFLSSTSEVADGALRMGLAPFPSPENLPFVLPEPRAPRASYALSKTVSEALFLQCGSDFRIRIGRYHNIYGPQMGYSHVIPEFIERALSGADPFAIHGDAQTRAFCYIDDAVDATVGIVRLDTVDPIIVNIGNDREETKIRDLADRVLALAGGRPEIAVYDPPAGSPDRRLPELSELRRCIGYEPRVDLDAGLRATFDWYSRHRRTNTDRDGR